MVENFCGSTATGGKTMRKLIIAAALALTPTAAGAETFYVMIDLDRYKLVVEAAKSVCPEVIDSSEPVSTVLGRVKTRLNLSPDEHLLLSSLCLLYGRGRADG